MSSKRLSLGGAGSSSSISSVFQDASNNTPSTRRRRLSLGGASLSKVASATAATTTTRTTPMKHYRSQDTTTENDSVYSSLYNSTKRARTNDNVPPRLPPRQHSQPQQQRQPPVAAADFVAEPTTALERYRLRKKKEEMMLLQQQQDTSSLTSNFTMYNKESSIQREREQPKIAFDDDDGTFSGAGFLNSNSNNNTMTTCSSTPISTRSRHRTLGTGPRRRNSIAIAQSFSSRSSSRRNSIMPPQEVEQPSLSQQQNTTLSQLSFDLESPSTMTLTTTTTVPASATKKTRAAAAAVFKSSSSSDDILDTVEGAARAREMQLRIDQLEKEKTNLLVSKAPLEARFFQKEEEWKKEEKRYLQELDSLKLAIRQKEDRYRDLESKYEESEEERMQLKLAVRKQASNSSADHSEFGSSGGGSGVGGWNRRVQIDHQLADLNEQLRSAEEEISSIRLAKVSVEKELHATKIELNSLMRSHDTLLVEHDELVQATSNDREAEIMLEHLTTEHIATSAQLNAVFSDLAATKAQSAANASAKDERHKKEVDALQFEISVLKTRAAVAAETIVALDGDDDVAVLKARAEEKDRRIEELEAELLKAEEVRRQMHNRIQELRGNVRVFVRTRPFLPSDGQSKESAIDVFPDGESLSIVDNRTGGDHKFKFDKVFPPSSGQEGVFNEVSDFVQSALDGYHVCLFSYGQTGSGKTHTMQGSGNGAMRGIIPRAVEQILLRAKVMQGQKWDFKLAASFLEIYNDNLNDLLYSMTSSGSSSSNKDPPKLTVKQSRDDKQTFVDGLSEIKIDTNDSASGMSQLDALMRVAARARSVANTKMNSQSSRSHAIFMLHLRGYNSETGAEVHGVLNLCDLAGSERLDRTGTASDNQRLKETQAINKSLSCLGMVFSALATNARHVNYRDSKLTHVLQDCLSGDGKALMFVNLSPTTASSNESLCSLKFAQRVNQVELGKPTKQIRYTKN